MNVLVEQASLQDIADAIREKAGTADTFKPSEMAQAIEDLPEGGITPTGELSISSNGTYNVTNYASAVVNIPTSGGVQSGTVIGNGGNTMTIPTASLCSNAICLLLSSDVPTVAAWKCGGWIYLGGDNLDLSLNNNSNPITQRGKPNVSFSANEIGVTNLRYTTFEGATYHWWAW